MQKPDRPVVNTGPPKTEGFGGVETEMIYCYDGSFDGLLCCVYESFYQKELPMDVLPETAQLPLLLPVKNITTDAQSNV